MSERAVRSMLYVDGSVVRKIDSAEPVRRPERIPDRRPVRRNEEVVKPRLKKQAEKALAFDMKYFVFVAASVCIMIGACVMMLFMQSRISNQKNNISSLEAQLETIENDNAAYKATLDNMYTIDDIYNVATTELGMVYAKKGQIVYYDSTNEDYVKQYQDVPDSK